MEECGIPERRDQMSNIYDIGRETGLSPSTVARALSGKGYCSEAARIKVQKAAKKLNYVPVQAAKSLKSKITRKVMFCIPDIYNPYYFDMIREVNRVLEQSGYYMILVHTGHDAKKELEIVDTLKERFVDGMIILSFHFDDKLMDRIRTCGLPVVLTNRCDGYDDEENFDCAYVDYMRAAYIATEYLLKKGHKKVGLLVGDIREQMGYERLEGYQRALRDAGVACEEDLIIYSDFTRAGGYVRFLEYLEKKGLQMSGLVACNDLMGIGCIQACRERGIVLPGQLSIVTLDNTDYCSCTYPELTSVDMRQTQVGQNAAELLMERIREGRRYTKMISLMPRLVERNSVLDLTTGKEKSSI